MGGQQKSSNKGARPSYKGTEMAKNEVFMHHFAKFSPTGNQNLLGQGAGCLRQGGCSPLSPYPGVITDIVLPSTKFPSSSIMPNHAPCWYVVQGIKCLKFFMRRLCCTVTQKEIKGHTMKGDYDKAEQVMKHESSSSLNDISQRSHKPHRHHQ